MNDRYVQQHSGKRLCVYCAKELTDKQCRVHALHCKSHRSSGTTINGSAPRRGAEVEG